MSLSVLMTVFNREPEVLMATLRSLWRSLPEDAQVVLVDDGSTVPYDWIKSYADARFKDFAWHVMEPYEAFRIDGFNNPAKAFNQALSMAKHDKIVVMSSDVLTNPIAVQKLMKFNLEEMAWTPLVIDTESGAQYCGPLRLFPAPWFLAVSKKHAIECGGWDETYLDGMCWEDNDFLGRVMLQTGRFIGDWSVIVYHQSHEQPAYRIDDPVILDANNKNKQYTRAKWSGLPFGGQESCAFDILRKPYVTGDVVHECKYMGTLLPDTIARTKSPFVKVPA